MNGTVYFVLASETPTWKPCSIDEIYDDQCVLRLFFVCVLVRRCLTVRYIFVYDMREVLCLVYATDLRVCLNVLSMVNAFAWKICSFK